MAITLTPEITGTSLTSFSYCYLNEPLRVKIVEGDVAATKIYIDVTRILTENDTAPEDTIVKYVTYDIINSSPITIDFMKIVKQIEDANIYKIGEVDDFSENALSFVTTVTRWKYKFEIYSDTASPKVFITKLPIVGGRTFQQFTADVPNTQPLTEFEYYGIDADAVAFQWIGVFDIQTELVPPTSENANPIITRTFSNPHANPDACYPEGFLVWKSRFGGWMFWGFDMKTYDESGSYGGKLDIGFFEATENGDPYVPVDYTSVSLNYTMQLKSIGLSSLLLKALSGIKGSPAVYYFEPNILGEVNSNRVELMQVSAVSAPQNSLSSGGDFSVSLKSISKINQNTI